MNIPSIGGSSSMRKAITTWPGLSSARNPTGLFTGRFVAMKMCSDYSIARSVTVCQRLPLSIERAGLPSKIFPSCCVTAAASEAPKGVGVSH